MYESAGVKLIMSTLIALDDDEYTEFRGAFRQFQAMRVAQMAKAFKIGSKIQFTSKGCVIVAQILKKGPKNFKARELTRDGVVSKFAPRWTVSPQVCEAVRA